MDKCVLCNPEGTKLKFVRENELAKVYYDGFPVTEYHSLIVPKRHVSDYFDLTKEELDAIQELLLEQRNYLLGIDPTIEGFNIGNNIGQVAGQTVWHVHTHLIPRRKGDMVDPKGGVRGVIPEKQKY